MKMFLDNVLVIVNGKQTLVNNECTVEKLILDMNLDKKQIAVEINQTILPRKYYPYRSLAEGDVVEFVYAVGGG